MRWLLTTFCAALVLCGCGKDNGRENCASEEAAWAVADQLQAIFGDDLWLKGKVNVVLSDVRTSRLDEKVALATCQASLRIRPPEDVVALLAMPAGISWLKANSLEYQTQAGQLVAMVAFEAQRTDDKKSMVVTKLEGHGQAVEGVRLLALRQPLVVDEGDFLPPAEAEKLSKRLTDFRLKTGTPIYLITVKKLPDSLSDGIADYTKRRVTDWRLRNGLLILMSKEDRKIRLETIGEVGERLPDARARELIAEVFVPRFKVSDFAGGLEAGLQSVIAELDR